MSSCKSAELKIYNPALTLALFYSETKYLYGFDDYISQPIIRSLLLAILNTLHVEKDLVNDDQFIKLAEAQKKQGFSSYSFPETNIMF